MGLDSVELLVAFEKRFNLSIPDTEAEWIDTVAEAAECIGRHLRVPVAASRSAVFTAVLASLLQCLSQQKLPAASITAATQLEALWPAGPAAEGLQLLAGCLALKIPGLPKPRTGFSAWLLGQPSAPVWAGKTVADFVDWLVALNQEQLLPTVATLYDVQRVVVGITSEKIGVPVDEIRLTDSFVNDLGID
ncbi:hypothetical protein [Hymenobacter lucidus]|uniref:Carrier domain-containing protein n=1 Tax=Hymenobacter lucidus TaxID=2880930 RepID=A0ABS8AMB3_9BACT|nr:hypothetical protein [Hymenobacter lucidus]MCB2407188.1 hypothetical protein [Hymenobacter lucidus]